MIRYLLLFLPFFVCAFFALLLPLMKDDKHHTKRMLAIYMLLSALSNLSNAFYFGDNPLEYLNVDGLFVLTSTSIYPLLYLYFVSISKKSIHQLLNLWHFAPSIILFAFYQWQSSVLTQADNQIYIDVFLYAKPERNIFQFDNPARVLAIFFLLSNLVMIIQSAVYAILSIKLLKSYDLRLKKTFSDIADKELRYFKAIVIMSLIVTVFALIFNTIGRYIFDLKDLVFTIPATIVSLLMFVIGYLGLQHNFTVVNLEEEEKQSIPIGDVVHKVNSSRIYQDLVNLMERKKLYLTQDLRITDLCFELNTNRTYLSQVINEEMHENFNSFINKYRVNHAISLLKDDEMSNYSLDKFAELSGFGSTISMIRAFRHQTGKTPTYFRN